MVAIDEDLVRAVQLWTGYGRSAYPSRRDQDIVDSFGDEVMQRVKELDDLFYASEAHREVADLVAMGKRAAEEFRAKLPGVDERITAAFEWCYTFDYK